MENNIRRILEELVRDIFRQEGGIDPIDDYKQEFDTALSQLKSAMMEMLPEQYAKEDMSEKSTLIEERKIWMKGYNQVITETKARVEELFK